MQRIRDEAHRFANTFQAQVRGKKATHSVLDDIPGIGPKRRKALQLHFGSVSKMKAATLAELAQAPGMNLKLAETVYDHLHAETLFSDFKEHRSSQVSHVEAQLTELYRPLRADLERNNKTWEEFAKARFPERQSFFDGTQRTKGEIEIWRTFMSQTFQPQNQEMSKTINGRVKLFVDGRIPPIFTRIVSHTEAYKAVMSTWGQSVPNEKSALTKEANTTLVNFPTTDRLMQCLNEQIKSLEDVRTQLQNPTNGLLNTVPEIVPHVCDEDQT